MNQGLPIPPAPAVARPGPAIVVIGAGLGGLAAALRLAHAGARVTVVERHAAPGGKMRQLPSATGPVDAGPTVLTMRGVFDALFADVGERISDHVSLLAEPLLARHFWPDGGQLDLWDDRAANRAAIAAFAGDRAAREFDAFSDRAARLFAGFEAPVMQAPRLDAGRLTARVLADPRLFAAMAPLRSLRGLLRGTFTDKRLAQLFARYATYVGGIPGQVPALLSLIWQAEAGGVWRVQGGMHALARAVANCAAAKGAAFIYGTGAAGIETAGGRVAAVTLEDGRRLPATAIVHAGDPRALHRGLLGPDAARAIPRSGVEPRSLSAWVWSFAAEPRGAELAHHNVFFAADPDAEFRDLAAGRMPGQPTLYICAQDRGSDAPPPAGPERFEIIQNAPPRDAAPGDETKERDACHQRCFPALTAFGLTFDPEPGTDSAVLTTPAGFGALFPGSAGSLYGRSPAGPMASFRRPTARTRLPGLYLAGGGAHPGAGVPMVTLSGQHAAAAIRADLALT
jgi:1-hydroxycarotenoid 3,4-desaturase